MLTWDRKRLREAQDNTAHAGYVFRVPDREMSASSCCVERSIKQTASTPASTTLNPRPDPNHKRELYGIAPPDMEPTLPNAEVTGTQNPSSCKYCSFAPNYRHSHLLKAMMP